MRLAKLFFVLLLVSYQINLWSQETIELPIDVVKEEINWDRSEREYYSEQWKNPVVSNVSKPTLTLFKSSKPNGSAVIICPGGGLYALSIDSEGRDVAKSLNEKGITAFVLKYRLVPTGLDATEEIMNDGPEVLIKAGTVLPLAISDGLNAVAHVRSNAERYQIDPNRIGLIGFSAGGAVTMGVAYDCDENDRPDFIGPIYAWMNVVPEHPVPNKAPPMFAMCATDDPLQLAPASVKLYMDWIEAGKTAELHMYARGGHGFGMKKQNLPSDHWIERFTDWMDAEGFMQSKAD